MENSVETTTTEQVEKTTETAKETKTYTEADLDRARTQASQTARANAEKELREQIRKELEAEAKMTAEEKAKRDFEQQVANLREERKELNRDRAVNILKEAGLDIDNSKYILESIVSDNKEDTVSKATAIANEFKINIEALRQKDAENRVKTVEAPKTTTEKVKSWENMSYEERLALKEKNPTLYAENVRKHSKGY